MPIASIVAGCTLILAGTGASLWFRAGLACLVVEGQLTQAELPAAGGLIAAGFGVGLVLVTAAMGS